MACLTRSGRIVTPSSGCPSLEDIAYSLFKICRYAGQCKGFYTVGQHSLIVANLLPPELGIYGLLHDAEECVTGDVTRMAKNGANSVIARLIRARLFAYLEIPQPTKEEWAQVKLADNDATLVELEELMPPLPGWSAEEKLVGQSSGREEPSAEARGLFGFWANRWTVSELACADIPAATFLSEYRRLRAVLDSGT